MNKTILERVLSIIIFFTPFVGTTEINKLLTVQSQYCLISAEIILMLFLVPFLFVLAISDFRIRFNAKNFYILLALIGLVIYNLSLPRNNYDVLNASIIGNIMIPVFFFALVKKIIRKFNLSIINIFKCGMCIITCYSLISIFYSVYRYDTFRLGLETTRLITTGGGPVIFGYTIPMLTMVIILFHHEFKILHFVFMIFFFLCVSIATGSRASIWPYYGVICTLLFLVKGKAKKLVFILILFCLLCALLIQMDILSLINPSTSRLFSLDSGGRVGTWISSIDIFGQSSFREKMLGFGAGKVFPLVEWESVPVEIRYSVYEGSYNLVWFMGKRILVQPHNTFVYLLLEYGLLGTSVLLVYIVSYLKKIKNDSSKSSLFKYLFLGLFILLNCFDSILIVVPAIAQLWYFCMFAVVSYKTPTKSL